MSGASVQDMSMAVRDTRISRPSDEAGVMLPYVFNQISCTPELIAIVCASVVFHWSDVIFQESVVLQTNMINVSHVWFFVAFDSFRCAVLAYSLYVIRCHLGQ